jgi:hypothetical protein
MRLGSFVAAVAIMGLLTSSDAAAEIPSESGYHTGVPLPGHRADVNDSGKGSNSYELYLPKGYGKAKETRHPVVIVLGMGAKESRKWIEERHLGEWAEGRNPPAIILGVNRLFNAGVGIAFGSDANEPKIPDDEGMTDYWELADKIPHAHPTMRFLISWPSGGSGDSQRVTALALKFPDKIAGYIVGPHPYAFGAVGAKDTAFKLRKDISVAVLSVTHESYARGRPETPYSMNSRDDFDPMHWERAYLVNLRSGGNPFTLVESIDWRLREPSIHEALGYLVDSGWQVKAGVTAAERRAGKQAMLGAMSRAAEIKDPIERERRYRSLFAVPQAAEWAEAKEALETYRRLVFEAAAARTEPLFKASFLELMTEHPLIKCSRATLNRVVGNLEDLRATDEYKKEFTARKAVRAAAAKFNIEQASGRDLAGLDATISAFQAALKIGEGTLAGKEARAWLEFLTKRRDEFRLGKQK